jgi:hypothetical protein
MYGSKFTQQDLDRGQYESSIDSSNIKSYQLIREYDDGAQKSERVDP